MPRRDDTFLLYYVEDFEGFEEDNPSFLVCLSESTIQLCLSALRFSHWPTRWRLNKLDRSSRIEAGLWELYRNYGPLAEKELMTDMGCDINEGLNAIASAIAGLTIPATTVTQTNENNCSGGGGCSGGALSPVQSDSPGWYQGSIEQGSGNIIPIFGTEPPLSISPGEFPEGYESREEYDLDKCMVANGIVDGLIQSLRNIAAFGVFNAVAVTGLLAIAIVGLITVPVIAIPLLAMTIGVLSVNITILAVVANEIEENRQDWVCALYTGDTVEGIISVLADIIDGLVSLVGASGPVQVAVKTIILTLMNGDTLSALMKRQAHLQYPDADCSGCNNEEVVWTFPEDVQGWEWSLVSGELPEGYVGQWDDYDPNDPSTGSLQSPQTTAPTSSVTTKWTKSFSNSTEFTSFALGFATQVNVNSLTVTLKSNLGDEVQTYTNQGNAALTMTFDPKTFYAVEVEVTFTNANPTYSFVWWIFNAGFYA